MAKKSDESQSNKQLSQILVQLRMQNSFVRRFLMGIVGGLGTAIGATIVASIVVYSLSRIIKTVDDVPILNNLIQTSRIEQVITPEN